MTITARTDAGRLLRRVAATGTLALVVAACGGLGWGSATDVSLDGDWELVAGEVDGANLEAPAEHRITLDVDDDAIGGTSACNSYGGRIDVDGQRVTIDQIFMTEMACHPPEVMEVESTYLDALHRVTSVARNDELVLSGPAVELRFATVEPVAEAELTGTTWLLDGILAGSGPDDTVTSSVGDPGTLRLDDDGRFHATTGCRELTGHYEIRGDVVVLVEASLDGECPPDVADQDEHVLAVLGDGFKIAVDGRRLTMEADDGRGLRYRAGG